MASVVRACRPSVSDDDSVEDDALGPRVCASPSPVDLLRAIPPPSRPSVMLSPRLTACCRMCDLERLRTPRVEAVPAVSDAACTCWVPAKPARHSPAAAPFLAPPPAPRRSRTLPTDRRRRVNDAYSTSTSGADFDVADVDLAASTPTRRLDCFRFCCVRSKPGQETVSRGTTGTHDAAGLTTVCHCSAVVDAGNGNRISRHVERNSKPTRGDRRRHVVHVLIACITALPVTCLALLGLFLMIKPLHHSTTGTCCSQHSQHCESCCEFCYIKKKSFDNIYNIYFINKW